MLRKISHVMIRVDDAEGAALYYTRVFGLRPSWSENGFAGLTFPKTDAEIVLHSDPSVPSPVEVCYLVDNVIAAVAHSAAQGCHVLVAPTDTPTGKYAVIEDPFGTPLSLVDTTKKRRFLQRRGSDGANDPY